MSTSDRTHARFPAPPADATEFQDPPSAQPVAISDDGRFVAVDIPDAGFTPRRSVVVDTKRGTALTVRGSGDGASAPSINAMSENARCALVMTSERISAADANSLPDAYLLDLRSGRYRLVSAGPDGTAVGGFGGDVTRTCRTVAFTSTAAALPAPGVPAGTAAAFARDLRRNRLVRAVPAGVRPAAHPTPGSCT